MRINGNQLIPDFVEDTVSTALQFYLTMISWPLGRFTVVPFSKSDERIVGSDARIMDLRKRTFLPFYMQFKRPFGYLDKSSSKIIKTRKKLKLNTSPCSLYFDLRRKTKKQTDFQHNILFDLNASSPFSGGDKGFYVCPLFLDKLTYFLNMRMSGLGRFWRNPFFFEDSEVFTNNGIIRFEQVPTLPSHVTIVPHAKVTSANHKYSFDENGNQVCFHSPLVVEGENLNLAQRLNNIQGDFKNDDNNVTPDNAIELLQMISEPFEGFEIDVEYPVVSWLDFGRFLKTNYDIEQFAFVKEID